MIKLLRWFLVLSCLVPVHLFAADRFETIKKDLAASKCTYFSFLSTIESSVFDQVDSAQGYAYIEDDGKYHVQVGSDEYIYDRHHLYTWSKANNQVTVETADDGGAGTDQVSFVTRLDEFFSTKPVKKGEEYRLIRKPGKSRNLPDTMLVYLDSAAPRISEIEYRDINGEINRLHFTDQQTSLDCDSSRFLPNFPDSVEVIKLW